MAVNEESPIGSSLASSGLPEELVEFLSRDTFSLLIKGESGTGKTILALSILRALGPMENVLYVSTRTSPLQLFEFHPWIEQVFGAPKSLAGVGGREKGEGWDTLVDSRLDEPNILFERVTNVLMDEEAPTVVIDSWEALSDVLGGEALRTNIRVLETWRERAGARFVFVGEDPTNTAIDSMVEGVVVLKDSKLAGRRFREMTLSKLHGIQIRRPSYVFTLDGGVFRSIPEYSPDDYVFRRPLPVRLERPFRREKGRFPTCYPPLDAALKGGLRPKSVASVELDPDVDLRVGLVFVSRMIQDWVAAGDAVVLQKPQGIASGFFKQYAKSFADTRDKAKLVIWDPSKRREVVGDRLEDRKILAVISPLAMKGALWWKDVATLLERTDLTVVLTRPGEGNVMHEAEAQLKIFQAEGTLFARSELPWSPLFGVIPSMTSGNPVIQLEPIV